MRKKIKHMAKTILNNGDDLVLLTLSGNQYFKAGTFSPGTVFTHHGSTVIPTVDVCESDGTNEIEYTTTAPITDDLGNIYYFIQAVDDVIGKRPKVKPR